MSDSLFQNDIARTAIAVVCGLATGYLTWVVASLWGKVVDLPPNASSFEAERRTILESMSSIYRNIQPLVLELAKINLALFDSKSLDGISRSMIVAAEPAPWKPEEFIASKQIEGAMAGLVVGAIILLLAPPLGAALVCFGVAAIYPMMAIAGVHDRAKKRLRMIKMRLPFVIDLMALMIEAGATFRDSVKTVVRENRDHPLGVDLARVDRQIELGRPRAEALRSFQERLDDHDVTELVFAINKGEELGTPLAKVLRNQADQMRLKRSQWGEKAAAEAQVKMAFPGMIVMIACVLVVLAPIVLPALRAFSEL